MLVSNRVDGIALFICAEGSDKAQRAYLLYHHPKITQRVQVEACTVFDEIRKTRLADLLFGGSAI